MNYREMNLINNALIIPPNEYRYCRYCPREEIAHPLKLKSIIDSFTLRWDIHHYDLNVFYVSWLPWFKTYKNYNELIHTSLFHILTEKPAMFSLFRNIINNPQYTKDALKNFSNKNEFIYELNDWLSKWWNTPFLITIPILHHCRGAFITDNLYPPRRMYLEDIPSQEYLDLQLDNQSYTICNGLTLFLAFHRLNIITPNVAYPILKNFIDMNKPHIFQDVTDVWYNLYYNTVISHIADFPSIYISNGPDFAHIKILRLFETDYDYQFAQTIVPTTVVYTSPFIAMFPYFNTTNWNYFQSNDIWLNTININYENDDILYPDITGFIHGMLTTKKSWKYWQNNYDEILNNLAVCYISIEKLIEDLIQTCCYYYKYGSPYHNKSLKRKVRIMWNNIIVTLDNTKQLIPAIFTRYILKHQMSERLISIGRAGALWMNEMPYGLLKDIFDIYKLELNLFTRLNFVIISEHIDILRIIYPDIIVNKIENDDIIPFNNGNIITNNTIANNIITNILNNNKYSIYRSPISILRDSFPRSLMKVFYENYIYKKIITKLCAIYKGFGIKTTGTLYNNHLIANLLLDYLKMNKNILIE